MIRIARIGLVLALAQVSLMAVADDAPSGPDYLKSVAPILKKHCAGCHNEVDLDGGFSLESHASLMEGAASGPAIEPGAPLSSRMLGLMTGALSPRMPPKGHPGPSESEIEVVRAWIEAGAKGPRPGESERLALTVPSIKARAGLRPITSLDISPDGKWLAVARYGEVLIHKIEENQSVVDEPSRRFGPLPGKVNSVHFSRDGVKLVTASGVAGLGGLATIWNVADGTASQSFEGHRDVLHDAELSPDGTVLATCGYDRVIELWNVADGASLRRLEGHNGAIADIAFSPDGRFLVSGSADDTCKVWRVADGTRMDTLSQPLKEVSSCAFSPDGTKIVCTGADNNVRVWRFVSIDRPDINPMTIARFAHEAPIVRAAFTPDGSKLITLGADRAIKVWDTSHYTEWQAWTDQPDVGVALAIAPDGTSFHVGRMDGTMARFDIRQAAPGSSQEGDASRSDGPRTWAEAPSEGATIDEVEPNQAPAEAQAVVPPVRIKGKVQGRPNGAPDFDLFRIEANQGDEWVIEVDAARSKSRLDSFVEVLDDAGKPVERVRMQAVRDSYFTFRGKDDMAVDDFRLFNWEEMKLNQFYYANGEVVKLWSYPRGPDSGFTVYPGQGARWGHFDTTPMAHALGETGYIVEVHPADSSPPPNGLPSFPIYFENDDESRRTLGKDSRLTFTAPADGSYVVKVRDVRGQEGDAYTYVLAIRHRRPDFQVKLTGADPKLAPGAAREFRLMAERRDGFDGPIRVDLAGLPPGIHASTPVTIEEGQIEALGVLWADADAKAPTPEQAKGTTAKASARVGDRDVSREVNGLGTIALGDKTPFRIAIVASSSGPAPVEPETDGSIATYEMRPSSTIELKVRVDRNEFKGQLPFGTQGAGRNLPFGAIVDDLGLNGLLILEDQTERSFFIKADAVTTAQERLFHLNTSAGEGVATPPVRLRIKP